MDSRDEEFTLENVDEQVEQLLASLQTSSPPKTFLARTIRNLQSVYEEDRRLENAWTRINRGASTLKLQNVPRETDEPVAIWPFPEEKNTWQESASLHAGSFAPVQHTPAKHPLRPRRWNRRNLGIVLVAAIALIIIFALPVFSYAFHTAQPAGSQTATQTATPPGRPTAHARPTAAATPTGTPSAAASPTVVPSPTITPSPTVVPSPTGSVPGPKEYSGQYFTMQYPAGWVITSVTNGGTYLQTVQFRPSVTSPVFVNVNALYTSDLTADLLLLLDPDVKLGTLLSTSTVTYHGIPWVVGTVDLAGSGQTQPSKLEVAYSNQKAPYRIEFGAPPDMFDSYTATFNAMFASFYPANP